MAREEVVDRGRVRAEGHRVPVVGGALRLPREEVLEGGGEVGELGGVDALRAGDVVRAAGRGDGGLDVLLQGRVVAGGGGDEDAVAVEGLAAELGHCGADVGEADVGGVLAAGLLVHVGGGDEEAGAGGGGLVDGVEEDLVRVGADAGGVGERVEEPAEGGADLVGAHAAVAVGVDVLEERGVLVEGGGGGGGGGPEGIVEREHVAQVGGGGDVEVVGLGELVELHGGFGSCGGVCAERRGSIPQRPRADKRRRTGGRRAFFACPAGAVRG